MKSRMSFLSYILQACEADSGFYSFQASNISNVVAQRGIDIEVLVGLKALLLVGWVGRHDLLLHDRNLLRKPQE